MPAPHAHSTTRPRCRPVLAGVLLLCATLSACTTPGRNRSGEAPANAEAIPVRISHPGYPKGALTDQTLFRTRDVRGAPAEYFMDVDSVACADDRCEIIPVRIFWDAQGNYLRYDLPYGGRLTKQGHKRFSRADSAKLHQILANPGSPLGMVPPDQIIPPEQAIQETDGITGATEIAHEDAVVEGALYTCYTLWNWAHGEARSRIRDQTGNALPVETLVNLVAGGPDDSSTFAMEQLARRRIYDPDTVQAVIHRLIEGGSDLADSGLEYLEGASTPSEADIYYRAVKDLLAAGPGAERIRYLQALLATPQAPPDGYYDQLSDMLPQLDTYYQVHLFLQLMETRNPESDAVTRRTVALLDGDSFFIARRAYWFLAEGPLTAQQRDRVNAFREQHGDRL